MVYKDIMTKRVYEKDGEEKAVWLKVGTLRENDSGKQFIELNMFPNTPFFVFEQREKDGQGKTQGQRSSGKPAQRPEDIDWEE